MKSNALRVVIMAIVVAIQWAYAKTPPDGLPAHLILPAKTEITIDKYLPDADVFLLSIRGQPAVGPNYVTPENLQKALHVRGLEKDFMKKLNREAGAIYVLKADLVLLWQKEVENRRKAIAK